MSRRLDWGDPPREGPPSRHPYRDIVLVYLGLAVVIVVVAVATVGAFVKAVVVAALFWLVGTSFGIVSRRRRQRGRELG